MIPLAPLVAVAFDALTIAQNSATLNALGPHPFGSPRNQAAAQFVAAKLKDAGLAQTTAEDFEFEGATGTNVIANLPGRTDRLLIIATHHDSAKDATDVSSRSRSLSLLIDLGRQASALRPSKTWILASFDGGESKGEGLAHYLETLGKNRSLVDGVVVIDAAASQESAGEPPSLIAPACASSASSNQRSIAGHDGVAAAVGGIPASIDYAFDDPGISLVTQPFIRAFKTACDMTAARGLSAGLSVLQVSDQSFSRSLISNRPATAGAEGASRDAKAVRLGELAFAAVQGLDSSTPSSPQSDTWLVIGRSVLPGFAVFVLGLATLVPGLIASRSGGVKLGVRVAYSAVFTGVLYSEPEVALFALALPSLFPPGAPRKFLALAFIPMILLVTAGALGLARGGVQGSWLSVWDWAGLFGAFALLCAAPAANARKAPVKTKRGKR